MKDKLISILTIAGSDSSGGAGIQADIKAADLCNVYASSAITAVTAQSTSRVNRVIPISERDLRAQLDSIIEDGYPDAIKIGMTGSPQNALAIDSFLDKATSIPIVIDPVLSSTSGANLNLQQKQVISIYNNRLFPKASVVTPNLIEAAVFLGENRDMFLDLDEDGITEIATRFLKMSKSCGVVLKGGHLSGDTVTDVLACYDDNGRVLTTKHSSVKIDCRNLHGSGCTLSTLLACELAKGSDYESAFHKAERMMNNIIERSIGYEYGTSSYGPLNVNNYLTR